MKFIKDLLTANWIHIGWSRLFTLNGKAALWYLSMFNWHLKIQRWIRDNKLPELEKKY